MAIVAEPAADQTGLTPVAAPPTTQNANGVVNTIFDLLETLCFGSVVPVEKAKKEKQD